MEKINIFDLHADMLCYLAANPFHTPYDLTVRCSIPQLEKGNVKFQGLPIFTETGDGSSQKGIKQSQAFRNLCDRYSNNFKRGDSSGNGVSICAAIENASSFAEEEDSFEEWMKKLEIIEQNVGQILYISLTWNGENRFGGGTHSSAGLKEDGRNLLEIMNNKQIPIDFSHASDLLAHDILNFIEKKGYILPILASHSNMRVVANAPRNLPDEIAKEIWRKGGVIGLNFVRNFVGSESPLYFVKQLQHVIRLGGEKQVCFGADFFCDDDLPPVFRRPPEEVFFPAFSDAGAYPRVLELWQKELGLGQSFLEDIAWKNLKTFLDKYYTIFV